MKGRAHSRFLARALLLAAVCAAPASAQFEGRPTASGEPQDLAAILGELRARHPRHLTLRELGRSSEGRPILAAVVGDTASASSGAPAVLLFPDLEGGQRAERAVLERLVEILEWSAQSEGSSPLGSTRVIAIPEPRPDGLRSAGETPLLLARNFPIDWTPWLAGPRSPGVYPLCAPESAALADFLLARDDLVLAIEVSEAAPRAEFAGGLAIVAPESALGGSFDAFLMRGLGLPLVELSLAATPRSVEELVGLAPHLSLRVAQVERLGAGTWRLDVLVANDARLSTARGAGELVRPSDGVRLVVNGASVLAASIAVPHDPLLGEERGVATIAEPLRDPSRLFIGPLAGGEARRVRLLVSGYETSRLELEARSPRAVSGELVIELE